MKKNNAARILDRANIEYTIVNYGTDPIELRTERVIEENNLHIRHKALVLSKNKTGVIVTCISYSSELKGKQIKIGTINLHSIVKATPCQTSNPKPKLVC